jgi:hypothetical protein
MKLTDTKLFKDLTHAERILKEKIAFFGHNCEENKVELEAVQKALKTLQADPKIEWTHW